MKEDATDATATPDDLHTLIIPQHCERQSLLPKINDFINIASPDS